MSEFIHDIKGTQIILPKWADMKNFSDDFTTIYIDFSRNGTMFYNHVLPDDAFHASMIGRLAAEFFVNYLR